MRFLQRPGADGGQGLAAQTALQRFRSVSRLFAWMVDTDEIRESPIARMKPPRVPEEIVPVIVELGRDADPGDCASCGRHAAPWLTATGLLLPRSARSKPIDRFSLRHGLYDNDLAVFEVGYRKWHVLCVRPQTPTACSRTGRPLQSCLPNRIRGSIPAARSIHPSSSLKRP